MIASYVFSTGDEHFIYESNARVDCEANRRDGYQQICNATGRMLMPSKGNVRLYKGRVKASLNESPTAIVIDCRPKK